jgi:hypothetical protein
MEADGESSGTGVERHWPHARRPAAGTEEDEPEVYYPTGRRNYFLVVAPEDIHAASAAVLARELGVRRLDVLKSTEENPLDGESGRRPRCVA